MQVTATDDDLGNPGVVRYRLVDDHMGRFNITEESGIISTAERLDYEKQSQYTITVEAYDLADVGERRLAYAHADQLDSSANILYSFQ